MPRYVVTAALPFGLGFSSIVFSFLEGAEDSCLWLDSSALVEVRTLGQCTATSSEPYWQANCDIDGGPPEKRFPCAV